MKYSEAVAYCYFLVASFELVKKQKSKIAYQKHVNRVGSLKDAPIQPAIWPAHLHFLAFPWCTTFNNVVALQ